MPIKRRFRNKYAGRSPERIWCLISARLVFSLWSYRDVTFKCTQITAQSIRLILITKEELKHDLVEKTLDRRLTSFWVTCMCDLTSTSTISFLFGNWKHRIWINAQRNSWVNMWKNWGVVKKSRSAIYLHLTITLLARVHGPFFLRRQTEKNRQKFCLICRKSSFRPILFLSATNVC